ncbi:thermonuclease family protein [Gemmobacter denitrificans]|uniref:Thermonuclease family protein n=1 Tax=Gemmobacter denitrificans TaxID=3123040 RepID=A0ABU8BPH5_9RHOB
MSPDLLVYVALLLAGLLALAGRYAPHEQLSEQGCRIGAVLDGDTVHLICGTVTETARLHGYDAPETRDAACEAERALGKRATLRLRELVADAQPGIADLGRDKYGRRLIRLRLNGQDVADRMVAEGLATPYAGGKRINWCKGLPQ